MTCKGWDQEVRKSTNQCAIGKSKRSSCSFIKLLLWVLGKNLALELGSSVIPEFHGTLGSQGDTVKELVYYPEPHSVAPLLVFSSRSFSSSSVSSHAYCTLLTNTNNSLTPTYSHEVTHTNLQYSHNLHAPAYSHQLTHTNLLTLTAPVCCSLRVCCCCGSALVPLGRRPLQSALVPCGRRRSSTPFVATAALLGGSAVAAGRAITLVTLVSSSSSSSSSSFKSRTHTHQLSHTN